MGFEEITIGKINSPGVFYFVPVHENYDVYKKQVKEMNEFFNLKEERSGSNIVLIVLYVHANCKIVSGLKNYEPDSSLEILQNIENFFNRT